MANLNKTAAQINTILGGNFPSKVTSGADATADGDLARFNQVPIKKLITLKWMAWGDSFTADESRYIDRVKTLTGITSVDNRGVPGDRSSQMVTKLKADIAAVPTMFDDIDILSVLIGTNDWGDSTVEIGTSDDALDSATFYGQMKYFIETVLTANPSMKIYLMNPIERDTVVRPYKEPNALYKYLLDFAKACADIANIYSLPFIDLYNTVGVNEITISTLLSDGVHPSAAGTIILGDVIANAFLNRNFGNTSAANLNTYEYTNPVKDRTNYNLDNSSAIDHDAIVFGENDAWTVIYRFTPLQEIDAASYLYRSGAYYGIGLRDTDTPYLFRSSNGDYIYFGAYILTRPPIGKEITLVISCDGSGSMSSYLDGNYAETRPATTSGITFSKICSFNYSHKMGVVQVYDTELTASQISDLQNDIENIPDSLQSNVKLKLNNQKTEATWFDESSNGSHGTVTACTLINNIPNAGFERVNAKNLNLSNLPTSVSGLSSGDVWNNSGVLTIV